jgi:AcrR family transcriptional regulator
MGRPRSTAAHAAALTATVDLLLEAGVDGVTLEDVAARSGVARSTLYRHFGSKDDLVVAAARSCLVEHPTPDTGSLEGDLRFLFDRYVDDGDDVHQVPDLVAVLIDAARRDPALAELVHAMLEERRRPMRTVLRLAQQRGEISPDLDLDVALSIIIGPFTHRRMIEGRDITPGFIETVLRSSIAGLQATATSRAGR